MCLCATPARARRPAAHLPRSAFPSRPMEPRPMVRALRRRSARRAASSRSSPLRRISALSRLPRPDFSCETPAPERPDHARLPRSRWISSYPSPQSLSVERGMATQDFRSAGVSAAFLQCVGIGKTAGGTPALQRQNPPAEACAIRKSRQSCNRNNRSAASSIAQGCGRSRNDSHSCLKTSACT